MSPNPENWDSHLPLSDSQTCSLFICCPLVNGKDSLSSPILSYEQLLTVQPGNTDNNPLSRLLWGT